MKSFVVNALAVAALSVSCMSVQAEEIQDSRSLYFALTGGFTFGGDDIAKFEYTNGDTEEVEAGGLVNLGLGALWQSKEQPIAAQVTLNYQFDHTSAKNGDATFGRVPLEAVVFYTGVQDWRFGAGVRYVANPELDVEIDGVDGNVEYKSTVGLVVEAGYRVTNNLWVNVRGVSEKYEAESASIEGYKFPVDSDKKFSGNHVGVNLVALF
ncbi:hypothetical protein EUZ85_11450 [Hahella sp. KA22]|uniref:hypothetical protein n=1 Tax=Hahella sp. KA22 TaxID=1628392 RepID=UPI000FDDDA2B|nr:hypothetical protein [Hahella sp. KA22]AZZ91311.1 hypothetical protein ENC22_08890 [Hahella sp. KA22]QAY54680.1 hypothetical protein EUZ85_11450 [Hahella sp. KA22]